ncbi:hypothetical protein M0R45_004654 [Rubus argutus]|uniref:Uncharacterized protein n=1 Tax=Rubus argutus TaxID=59490 RepID=A0AAW1YKC3_RUBAR
MVSAAKKGNEDKMAKDAITLISSFSSALVAFVCWMNLKRNGNLNKSQKMALLRDSGTMLALIAMVLAHISGTYALYGQRLEI